MSAEQKSFTVRDRRSFTAEGEPRSDEPSPAGQAVTAVPHDARPTPPSDEGEPPVTLSSFLVSLAAQCAACLHGESDEAPRFAQARQLIAVLEMLKDKTEARRTADENELIEGLLYQLRMAYVEATRAPGHA